MPAAARLPRRHVANLNRKARDPVSEYQYYEFQAIDRPLSDVQMQELRALSSRATITPTSFVNVYNWGDFRGDPHALMAKYFDAFLYLANWGTRRFMLRLPSRLLDEATAAPYCAAESAMATTKGDFTLLNFWISDEDGGDWVGGEGWLPTLVPLRAELLAGDLRCLYLAWLLCAEGCELEDEALEPALPPGCPSLRELSPALEGFADFFGISSDLIEVAAEGMPPDPVAAAPGALRTWVRGLPESEKDALLLRVADGEGPGVGWEILKRFREARAATEPDSARDATRRTVAQLRQLRDERAREREQRLAKQRAKEKARRAREQARAREQHLDGLAGREEKLWQSIEALIASSQPKKYEEAVRLATDLRDLAERQGASEAFQSRLAQLRERHRRKWALLKRLDGARLGG